jgi:hypothetical protein
MIAQYFISASFLSEESDISSRFRVDSLPSNVKDLLVMRVPLKSNSSSFFQPNHSGTLGWERVNGLGKIRAFFEV